MSYTLPFIMALVLGASAQADSCVCGVSSRITFPDGEVPATKAALRSNNFLYAFAVAESHGYSATELCEYVKIICCKKDYADEKCVEGNGKTRPTPIDLRRTLAR